MKVCGGTTVSRLGLLVVSLSLDPAAWRLTSEQKLSGLIVAEDEDGEGDGWDPPVEVERVHPQALVHARAVGEEGSQAGLEEETEVEEMILHSLLEDRVFPCFADDEVSPLHNHNGGEESCVTRIL